MHLYLIFIFFLFVLFKIIYKIKIYFQSYFPSILRFDYHLSYLR
jgi:hypothetical protein